MTAKPRVLIAGFQHETNTFGATNATYQDFEMADGWPPLLFGEAVIDEMRGMNLPIAGFFEAAEKSLEIIPVLWCAAEPAAHVTNDAFERITALILRGTKEAGALDGIYLDLHGAMVTQSHEDGEGALLGRVRDLVGPDMPVAVSLDLHANVTAQMVECASVITIFREYPHLDMAQTGARAFGLLERLLNGEKAFKSFAQVPFLIPLQAQHTGSQPCASLYGMLEKGSNANPLRSSDIAMGFPAADIAVCGPAVVSYGATQCEADKDCASILEAIVGAKDRFEGGLFSPADAIAKALDSTSTKPTIFADVQDNPGAGASSDTTGIVEALLTAGVENAVVALLHDADVVRQAHGHWVGASFDAVVGGKTRFDGAPPPLAETFRVVALHDGNFDYTGEMYAGGRASIGPMALLEIVRANSQVQIALTSVRCQCLDQAFLRVLGGGIGEMSDHRPQKHHPLSRRF